MQCRPAMHDRAGMFLTPYISALDRCKNIVTHYSHPKYNALDRSVKLLARDREVHSLTPIMKALLVVDLDLMASVFGIMGTTVAFLVYLAPMPTFYRIFKKKSTLGFPSLPYAVALFCAMLTLYYAYVKTNCLMLIAINSVGCFIETVYLVIFITYAPRKSRIFTAKLLVLFNIFGYGAIVLSTALIPHVPLRLKVVGWITIVFNVCVFAAPLSIMRRVIKTKSVEYMSLPLSLSLTLCAVMWFFYGLLIKDIFIAAPNVLGFVFGVAQMISFCVYRKKTMTAVIPEPRLHDLLPITNRVPAPSNDDRTVTIVVDKKSSDAEEDDDDNQLEAWPRGMPTVATALGLLLRRGSI